MNNSIITRLQKLLALSRDGGATEAEASLAAGKVQELLQQHNLSMSELEATDTSAPATVREKRTHDRRAMYTYQQDLMASIAEGSFCLHKVVKQFAVNPNGTKRKIVDGTKLIGRIEKRHLLVGRDINVEGAIRTYNYLLDALSRLCRDAGYVPSHRDGHDFLTGAVLRVSERLAEKRRTAEADSAATRVPGNGSHRELILSDVYGSEAELNNDALNGFPPGTTAAKHRKLEARRVEQETTHARLVADGVDTDVAWYRAFGYSETSAVEMAVRWKRTSRRSARRTSSRRWTAGNEAHYRRIASPAYQAGKDAGSTVGLDAQVGRPSTKQIGG